MIGKAVIRKTLAKNAVIKKSSLGKTVSAAAVTLLMSPALYAGSLDLTIEIPSLQVAE